MSIIGPDGMPVDQARVEVKEGSLTYRARIDGMPVKVTPEQLLMDMARAQRDGASLAKIIVDFELVGEARSPFLLQRALDKGHVLLGQAIAQGKEPADAVAPSTFSFGPDIDDD